MRGAPQNHIRIIFNLDSKIIKNNCVKLIPFGIVISSYVLLLDYVMNTRIKISLLLFVLALSSACAISTKPPAVNLTIQDWPSFGRDFSSQRFSPSTQINTSNVQSLVQAWKVNTGVTGSFQTTPIVQNGVMYLSLPYNKVVA